MLKVIRQAIFRVGFKEHNHKLDKDIQENVFGGEGMGIG